MTMIGLVEAASLNITIYVLSALGALVFLALLVLSSLPSPTVRELLSRFRRKGR